MSTLTADLSVGDIMERWPETIVVFLAYRMACVGCFMAPFDTLAEAAHNYRLDIGELIRALQEQIETTAGQRNDGAGRETGAT